MTWTLHRVFSVALSVVALAGVFVNAFAFRLLTKKVKPTLFHLLLKVLTAIDLVVVLCLGVTYGLCHVWPGRCMNNTQFEEEN